MRLCPPSSPDLSIKHFKAMNILLNPHVRVGKIARLPEHIREELNYHLCANESGLRLLDWLNRLPEVQAILARDFGSRPINSVNLTKWKAGGYREWMFRREMILTALQAQAAQAGIRAESDRSNRNQAGSNHF
jgi:hypothetical protein